MFFHKPQLFEKVDSATCQSHDRSADVGVHFSVETKVADPWDSSIRIMFDRIVGLFCGPSFCPKTAKRQIMILNINKKTPS